MVALCINQTFPNISCLFEAQGVSFTIRRSREYLKDLYLLVRIQSPTECMPNTFESDNDVIIYAVEIFFFFCRTNQHILEHSLFGGYNPLPRYNKN